MRNGQKAVSLTSLMGRLSLLIVFLLPSTYSMAQEVVGEEVMLGFADLIIHIFGKIAAALALWVFNP